ncbi:superoxide dismutase [Pontibacillus yanchengensis]|uniref:Superoxide dismutase n=2 Tax=Pontibacillus yanchengensis TaxID=462910 RepID=A0ACC7VLL0_9BACI|nr:superoxide dismutase [Pontibacillus yanchengensis]MYL32690.1 superoxide dismutase [Pontibacillus yanchengensis]MYL55084.1 superoxide dismutase [Pontibacillus yanchengensis]
MLTAKKQYLHSLLNWAEEVEKKVNSTHMSEENQKKWNNQMKEWKKDIQEVLQQDDISHEQMNNLQAQGQKLLQSLGAYYDNEREKKSVPTGEHKLPPLPYPYDALEPYISKEIMRLHHDVHHKSYVDGLNKAENKLAELRKTGKDDLIKHWLRQQSFNGSGHFLHTIFWFNMKPNGGGKPKGDLLKQINKDFGSFAAFKKQFSDAAKSVEGVGWAILVWEMRSGRLAIQTVEKHQMFSLWDVVPLLVLDVWEHAYYLQYQTKRGDYVKNWWNIVNWDDVATRFNSVKDLIWSLY